MTSAAVVAALAALAQQSRLDIFRLLVRRGPEGVSAGDIAEALGISAPTLSFHLAQLRHAGLILMRRESRSLIYTADSGAIEEVLGFLAEHCCASASGTMRRATKTRRE